MEINLQQIKKVYFLGIGGIGVSAIARMMKSEGKDVSGRDPSNSVVIEALEKEGIQIQIGPKFEYCSRRH
jgi:UDP-N-acetylmuramate--alanine ligase